MADREFDLSMHPSYLPSRAGDDAFTEAESKEAVGRGLFSAAVGALAGIVLMVVIWRQDFVYPVGAVAMSGAAVLLYARSAGHVPRRGLLPLSLLLLSGMALGFLAIVASDGWIVYSLVADEMPMSRADFIRGSVFRSDVLEIYRATFLQLMACAVVGALGGMWRVHRAAR